MKLLHSVFRPPVFEDEDQTRAAVLLHFILVFGFIFNLFTLLGAVLLNQADVESLTNNALAIVVLISLYVMMRKGLVRQASFVLILFSWSIISLATYRNMGILDPLFSAQSLTVIIAGLLINGLVALGVAGLSSLFGLLLVQSAYAGTFPLGVGDVTVEVAWVSHTAFFFLTALFLWVNLRAHEEVHKRVARQERDLNHSEKHYRSLIQNASDSIYVIDRNHRIALINRVSVGEPEDYVGRSIYDFILPEVREAFERVVRRVFEHGSQEQIEMPVKRADGRRLQFSIRLAPIWENNQVSEIIALGRDVTDQKMSADALRASEEQYRELFESNPHPMFVVDAETARFLAVNDAMVLKYGYSRDEFAQLTLKDVLTPDDWTLALSRSREFKGENRDSDVSGPWHHHKKDGSLLQVEISSHRLNYDGRNAMMTAAYDVTERLRAEAAMRASEERFRALTEEAADVVGILDRDGEIVFISPAITHVTGHSPEELMGSPAVNCVYPDDRPIVMELLEKTVHNPDETQSAIFRDQHKDGSLVLVEAVTRDMSENPAINGIVLNLRDVTERKRAEAAQLEAERMQLEIYKEREVVKLKEEFISTMSHEFRTPLAIILAASESLQRYYDRLKPERREEHFYNIKNQVLYVTSMLDEVLTLGKARSSRMRFNPTPIEFVTFCKHLFEQVQMTDAHYHQFIFADDGKVSEIMGDEYLLQHIMINLLSNAIKYSPEGTEVRLGLSKVNDDIVIQVSDQGIGVPEEDQKFLFEAFYRASNTRSFKGTGLGLAIVQESVAVHGGTVTCESMVGKGTTFTVRLPAHLKN